LKRAFDILFASLGLLLLLPLGLLLSLLIKISDGGPVFYRQLRVGQFGKPFHILKFRSMVPSADKLGAQLTQGADPRITRIGWILRKTKLDELPQLWNVLVGQMSFVGPRPEVPKYVERYTQSQAEILQLKPGITDLASLAFRNEESLLEGAENVEDFYLQYCLPKKIELNRQYAAHAGVLSDLLIIGRTLSAIAAGFARTWFGRSKPSSAILQGTGEPAWRVGIIGAGDLAGSVAEGLTSPTSPRKRLVAVFDDNPLTWSKLVGGIRVFGMPECILNRPWRHQFDEVILAPSNPDAERTETLLALLKPLNLKLTVASGRLAKVDTSTACLPNRSFRQERPPQAEAGLTAEGKMKGGY
jgi:lipopolysaccharide/colanic/teichoic acid biosynthesis glycosyltransferase